MRAFPQAPARILVMSTYLKRYLPSFSFSAEAKILSFFFAVWAMGLILGLPINLPDMNSYNFIVKHYFKPFFLATFLEVTLLASNKLTTVPKKRDLMTLKLLPLIICAVFIHFNFKAWMPLVNSEQYDRIFQQIDIFFEPLLNFFLIVRQVISKSVPLNFDILYHHLFIAMFYLSFTAHALFDRPTRFRQLILSACLILLVGGICYWIAPAEGPFLFRMGVNAESIDIQRHMHLNIEFVKMHKIFPAGYFVNAPAAMPSLHIAHSLMFTFFIWRSHTLRWLLLLYVPATFWLIIESVSSGWHYLVDLPAGALLCFSCIYISAKFMKNEKPRIAW